MDLYASADAIGINLHQTVAAVNNAVSRNPLTNFPRVRKGFVKIEAP